MNGYLIKINDIDRHYLKDYDNQKYLNTLDSYRKKVNALKDISSVEEGQDGFIYKANIDLEAPGFIIPSSVKDPNYYKMDSKADVVHYAMIGKGFDCE